MCYFKHIHIHVNHS